MPGLSYDKILNTECLFCAQAKTRDRIRVRRDRSDADFHLSIVNDQMFGLMMNNRGRLQFPCMLISLVFDIPFLDLIENAEFYKEFIDKEKLQAKGEIADCMIIYRDSIFNIEMNGTHTLARNQDYIHKASIIQNKRGKRKFQRRDYYQINLNNFRVDGHDEVFEVYQPLDRDGDLYGYQTFVNVFLLNLRDKYYTKGIKSLDECERYIMGLVETSGKRTNELSEGSEILMEYKEELESIEYLDLPDPVDKVAEEIEIE
ncbi:MAG TPA: hypothetical protein DCY94_03935, partial [Firmicutes bacterium]|nr:hypothetical protein [Bacillota bacterium]